MSNPESLQTIDPAALAQVSGGTTTSDDALSTALSGILEGIQSLANNQQQGSGGGFNPQEMMMMMMMLNKRNQQETAAAVAPAWGTPQVYYY